MRIVSGKYKSRRFEVPRSFKSRPTTDFAKENLFNVIGNLIDLEGATALDLFSGTGSISYELLSRGCLEVVSVEKDPAHHAFIRKVKEELKAENLVTFRGDVFSFISSCNKRFDFIFADPPFQLEKLDRVPSLILESDLLKSDGILVVEHPKQFDFSGIAGFSQKRVYGAVNFSIFACPKKENHEH